MQETIFYETSMTDEQIKKMYSNHLDQLNINELRSLTIEKSQLYFNETKSLWYSSGIVHLEGKLSAYSKVFNRVEVNYYRDIKAKEFFETTRFPKNKDGFYEMGSESIYNWILTENKESILGYECLEAILKDDNGATALKVYYTPDIKASVGPSKYYGLDGAILKVYIPNESTTMLAYKVDLQKIPERLIEKPDTTNLLQRAEYLKILTKREVNQQFTYNYKSMEERFYALKQLIDQAFSEGDYLKAQALAEEYLQLAADFSKNWNYGNAIHNANLALGRIALKEGKVEAAKAYLLKAGNTPGSPQLGSFGPNMSLAKELLELYETSVVLEYLDLCSKFWQPKMQEMFGVDQWKSQIESGQIPDFKANMVY